LPYWPLFVLLLFFSALGAAAYLVIATPLYSANAKILLKDEKKGADDAHILESLNIYGSKKIVENEMEVLASRTLMKEVATKLGLYAQVVESSGFRSQITYNTAPVIIEAREPDNLNSTKEPVPFAYDKDRGVIAIENVRYAVNQWVNTPYGVLKFNVNPKADTADKGPFFFSLASPRSIASVLASRLAVATSNKVSTVLDLTYVDEVPKRAEDILNAIIAGYTKGTIDEKNELATNTLAFIDERLKIVKSDLENIESRIQQYKSKQGIVDLSVQSKVFLDNVGDNDRKISDLNMQLAVLDRVEESVTSKNADGSIAPATLGLSDDVLSKLLQRLYDIEGEYGKLKETNAENSPALMSSASEINKLRSSILENVRNQRKSLEASRNNLMSTNSGYATMLSAIPQKERELLEISRQQAIKNSVYSFLLQKREETALSSSATVADSRVIDPAESLYAKVSPKKFMAFILSMVLAFVIGVIIVIAKELLTGKILFRSDIEKYTKVPIVGEVTSVKHKSELVVNNTDKPFVSEQFRQLRAAIGLYGKHAPKKKILVTSSVAGEGKSFVASNLAMSLALSGKKVVLLDVDLRSPKTSSNFNLEDVAGMAEYLQGNVSVERVIKNSEFNNLFIVPAGGACDNPTELLINGRLSELFAYLENAFDYILVDTSPVDPVTDAYVLSQYCDRTLFVIRHAYTPKAMVQLLDENNKIKALNNLAIVFNGVKKRGFIKGSYGYGYGFGYEYVYKGRKYVRNKKVKSLLG